MTQATSVRVEQRDAIVHITLSAPEKGNRLDAAMDKGIREALAGLDASSRAVILAAEGPDFCTGREFAMPPGRPLGAHDIRGIVAEPVLSFYGALRKASVPVIAAVRGRALGVGCALAACADFIIASETASFAVTEMDHDTPPLLVMSALRGKIATTHAMYMVVTRNPVGAGDALAMGLASQIVADEALDAECAALAARIAGNSPLALQTAKRFALAGDAGTFDLAAGHAADLISLVIAERFR